MRISTEERIDYAVVVDATTGDVLSVDQLSSTQQSSSAGDRDDGGSVVDGAEVAQAGGCGAPSPPSACIFVVDDSLTRSRSVRPRGSVIAAILTP